MTCRATIGKAWWHVKHKASLEISDLPAGDLDHNWVSCRRQWHPALAKEMIHMCGEIWRLFSFPTLIKDTMSEFRRFDRSTINAHRQIHKEKLLLQWNHAWCITQEFNCFELYQNARVYIILGNLHTKRHSAQFDYCNVRNIWHLSIYT